MEKLLEDLREKIVQVNELSMLWWDSSEEDHWSRWEITLKARELISEMKKEALERGLRRELGDRIWRWGGKEDLGKDWPSDFNTVRFN